MYTVQRRVVHTFVASQLNPGVLLLVELECERREGLNKLSHLFPRLRGERNGKSVTQGNRIYLEDLGGGS